LRDPGAEPAQFRRRLGLRQRRRNGRPPRGRLRLPLDPAAPDDRRLA
jgi:hypothetical protein